MKNIPIRQINPAHSDVIANERFNIRSIEQVIAGKDMVHDLHRHDYFFVLAIEKGKGKHEIDFTSYDVADNSFYFLRPGQVHQLELKVGSTGYLFEFNTQFFYPGKAFKSIHEWVNILGPNFMLGINTIIYSTVFFKTSLVPRILSIYGIISSALIFLDAILELFGLFSQFSAIGMTLSFPIFSYEMILAGWLIKNGFNIKGIQNDPEKLPVHYLKIDQIN